MNNRVINNDSRLVSQIRELGLPRGARVWQDDGSVGVVFNGSRQSSLSLVRRLSERFGWNPEVGDGVQEGSFWFQNVNQNMFGELSDFEFEN